MENFLFSLCFCFCFSSFVSLVGTSDETTGAETATALRADTPVPADGTIATDSGAAVGGVVDWIISFSRFRFCICSFAVAESTTSAFGPITAPDTPVKASDAAFKVSVGVHSAVG